MLLFWNLRTEKLKSFLKIDLEFLKEKRVKPEGRELPREIQKSRDFKTGQHNPLYTILTKNNKKINLLFALFFIEFCHFIREIFFIIYSVVNFDKFFNH